MVKLELIVLLALGGNTFSVYENKLLDEKCTHEPAEFVHGSVNVVHKSLYRYLPTLFQRKGFCRYGMFACLHVRT